MRHFVTMSLSATRTNKFKPKNVGLREYNDSFQSSTTLTEGPNRKMLACESVTAPVQLTCDQACFFLFWKEGKKIRLIHFFNQPLTTPNLNKLRCGRTVTL